MFGLVTGLDVSFLVIGFQCQSALFDIRYCEKGTVLLCMTESHLGCRKVIRQVPTLRAREALSTVRSLGRTR